ncbi:hypothetical protein ASPACDRAFT_48512 [Aspergillus aculeatus ATCC 16872]|uniref:Secreted protein CSS2 C-terminal domain-containing protein n=1 Tax=Aspergillus aculeatus (strain ATCC 16872 / CBS 172.66 / WB 5094) TaxID=690307 RepID=A0A1L9WF72_ASPA1|nr:uncharacterized protein ASPACDRAFT_48512 [Aspergillus aculeatus ATCC 16872]OJJ94818.1 hypothetical protein ASPACDRAFT_48512 [Aspergillus aculeatus ATCC 16872]
MRFLAASMLTLNTFYGVTLSQPSSLSSATDGQLINGQPLPDSWYRLHLDDSETVSNLTSRKAMASDVSSTTSSLVARTPMTVCEKITAVAACATIAASIDGWSYEYYATGRNCDTTAQQETIHGALYHYLTTVDNDKVCGTQCLSLDHGGTYEGYLKLGKVAYFDPTSNGGEFLGIEDRKRKRSMPDFEDNLF